MGNESRRQNIFHTGVGGITIHSISACVHRGKFVNFRYGMPIYTFRI